LDMLKTVSVVLAPIASGAMHPCNDPLISEAMVFEFAIRCYPFFLLNLNSGGATKFP